MRVKKKPKVHNVGNLGHAFAGCCFNVRVMQAAQHDIASVLQRVSASPHRGIKKGAIGWHDLGLRGGISQAVVSFNVVL